MKYQFKSVTFYLFIFVVGLFYFTQFAPPDINSSLKPIPPNELEQSGSKYHSPYGITLDREPKEQIKAVYIQMLQDLTRGEYLSYGSIINRSIKLSKEKKKALIDAMEEISPGTLDAKNLKIEKEGLNINVTFERFEEIVRGLDRKLGGSTVYSDAYRLNISQRPRTYEEAAADFNSLLQKDKLTNGYGRYFADYMGITAGFFPIFLAAFLLTRDRRSRMHELINSRKVSSVVYLTAKFTALSAVLLLCYLVFATHAAYVFYMIASANSYSIDMLAFYKYTLFWVLPTILFTTSVGMLISTIFDYGIVAIPVQFIIWMSSMLPLKGDYSLYKSVLRFNTVGDYDLYIKWLPAILTNRVFYTIISIVLVLIASWIWSWKRGAGDGLISRLSKPGTIQR